MLYTVTPSTLVSVLLSNRIYIFNSYPISHYVTAWIVVLVAFGFRVRTSVTVRDTVPSKRVCGVGISSFCQYDKALYVYTSTHHTRPKIHTKPLSLSALSLSLSLSERLSWTLSTLYTEVKHTHDREK